MVPETILAVRVVARAGRERVEGWRGGRLLVWTTAPPVEGRANDAVCRLIAETLGVAPSRVAVTRGARGREKAVRISGLSREEILYRLRYHERV